MTAGKNSHGYHYMLVNLVSNNHAAPLRGSLTIYLFIFFTHSWADVCSREKSALHVFHFSVNVLFVLVRSLHVLSPDTELHTHAHMHIMCALAG